MHNIKLHVTTNRFDWLELNFRFIKQSNLYKFSIFILQLANYFYSVN